MPKLLHILLLAALCLGTTVASAPAGASYGRGLDRVDRLVVFKSERRLVALRKGRIVRSYRVSLGKAPLGPKRCRGDNRTPEGEYQISRQVPDSTYFLALHISYPSREDVARAREAGCDPGGSIEIHGLAAEHGWMGRRHLEKDWTNGCIAVTNEEMRELYARVPVGTPIEIYP